MRLMHSSKALPARCTTWKGSMTALASGSSSAAALLNPVNPSIATISIRLRHVSGWEASQVLKTFFGAARDHIQEPGGAAAVADGCQVQDNGDEFAAVRGVAPPARAWRADRPLRSCPGATHGRTPGTGSGARSRARSWGATRKARAPSA